MFLAIAISKANVDGPKEATIVSNSGIENILHFFNVLGTDNWELWDKGASMLESNGPDLYVSIGPRNPRDRLKFLEQARSFA